MPGEVWGTSSYVCLCKCVRECACLCFNIKTCVIVIALGPAVSFSHSHMDKFHNCSYTFTEFSQCSLYQLYVHNICGCIPLNAECMLQHLMLQLIWGRCHGGLRPSSDDSFHSPTVIPPSTLDKPSIMMRLPSSANAQSHLTLSFADDDNA